MEETVTPSHHDDCKHRRTERLHRRVRNMASVVQAMAHERGEGGLSTQDACIASRAMRQLPAVHS